jgi:hypothetical protein
MSPASRPIMAPGHLNRVQQLLGEPYDPSAGVREQYRRNLAFARKIEAALKRADVEVRDMVDVESLITICALWQELWVEGADAAGSNRASEPEVYLAACLMYRNEADHLAEWIEFHKLVGVERFFLYDNESDDHHLEVVAPYLEEGTAVRHAWPGPTSTRIEVSTLQARAYDHCISAHRAEARWIAFIDADEFLFSPTGRPVSEILADYERWPGVVVNWAPFGMSGHATRAPGLVIENYTGRFEGEPAELRRMGMPARASQVFKSIVDPAAVLHCENLHAWQYARGAAVDEHGYPVSSKRIFTKSTSYERIRINHYFARSEADVRAKYAIRSGTGGAPPGAGELQDMHPGVRDETILVYLPQVREALRRRSASFTAGA